MLYQGQDSDGHVKHKQLRKTTVGWNFLIEWDDGSRTWMELKDIMIESNPIEVAEYAVARKIDDEWAFEWWGGFHRFCRSGT